MTARDDIKAEAESMLDHIVHNIGTKIEWARVRKGLVKILETLDAGKLDGWASAQAKADEAEIASRQTAWLRKKEAEEKAKAAEERANASDAAFKKLHAEFMVAQQQIDRLKRELLDAPRSVGECQRVLTLVAPIINAMLEHFDPRKHGGKLAEDGVDPTDADGVAYGEKIGVGELRYGNLEVANGALQGLVPGGGERLLAALSEAHPRPLTDGSTP